MMQPPSLMPDIYMPPYWWPLTDEAAMLMDDTRGIVHVSLCRWGLGGGCLDKCAGRQCP